MEPRIVQLDRFILVGRPYYGDSNDNKFGLAWERFLPYEKEITQRVNPKVSYGLEVYGPEFEQQHQWTYLPAMQVASLDEIPLGLFATVVPAASYAVFTAKGDLSKIGEAFHYGYMTWLPASPYKVAYPFDFEWYDERFKDNDPSSEVDIYIPIKPKAS